MPVINGIYTKDFPDLGRDGLGTDLIPVAITGNVITYKVTLSSLMALYATLASPTFTGTPAAPTAAPGTNTTQLATTAFVIANAPTISFGSFGSTANAQGGSYSAGTITLQPASASFPGGVTTGTQTFAGSKTFSATLTASGSIYATLYEFGSGQTLASRAANANFIYSGTSGLNFSDNTGAVTLASFSNAGAFTLNSLTSGLVKSTAGLLSNATAATDYTLLNGTGIVEMAGTTASYLSSTGTGNVARATSPTFTTPNIGAATFSTLTGGTASTIAWANTSNGNVTNSMSIRNGGTTTGTGNGINFVTGAALNSARINSVLTSTTAGDLVFTTMTASVLGEAGRFLSDKTLSLAGGLTVPAAGTVTFTSAANVYMPTVIREGTTGNAFFQYSTDTRFINLNGAGKIAFRNNANSADNLTVSDAGVLTALNLAGTGDRMVQASSTGELSATATAPTSGTYTPTLTNGTNVTASTAASCNYIRVGNQVMVQGSVQIEPTAGASTNTVVDFSLPIASNFSSTSNLNGQSNGNGDSYAKTGIIAADSTNDTAQLEFPATNTGSQFQIWFSFTYTVQ